MFTGNNLSLRFTPQLRSRSSSRSAASSSSASLSPSSLSSTLLLSSPSSFPHRAYSLSLLKYFLNDHLSTPVREPLFFLSQVPPSREYVRSRGGVVVNQIDQEWQRVFQPRRAQATNVSVGAYENPRPRFPRQLAC